ncbi:2-hydroxychromene-2-carboxylate isomerase [Sedimenticola selenatireducens]|uniref:2-hydroxychromene-2-carboxylate isomerase n=1 Tax=Sedimenticola selenatireducens TaxID=191960 RepID=A0A2N6D0L8_9GAMM|nr:2-hydroxychromene-2-carboxylate isomerase [Sedimenticola selenatireducens]PLX63206.1 MAG: 2-hydroxychromene-2-carboxylate isomerase [Sedimenticola selenatireducens]
MSAPLEFYFDFYSPYGYLASARIDEIATKHGREVIWRPFLVGATFALTGARPLVDIPLQGDYSLHDMRRCAREQGLPFQLPDNFPKAALAASRAFYWLVDAQPEKAKALARKIYHATFGEGRDGTDANLVADLAVPLGIDREQLLLGMQSPEVKARLKQETEAAVARGVFGSPYIFVDGEPFWGNDRLEQVDRWLATGGW